MLPALRDLLGPAGLVDHHCHSLRADWSSVARTDAAPAWRQCFTEATDAGFLERDAGHLLGYRHFLAAFAEFVHADGERGCDRSATAVPSRPSGTGGGIEGDLVAARDRVAGAPYLHRLLDDADTGVLLVDTGLGGSDILGLDDLGRASGRDVREIVRLESVAEGVLAAGGPTTRSLPDFVDAVLERVGNSLDSGAVAIKSVLAYRAGLQLPRSSSIAARQALSLADRRRQAQRLNDPLLAPLLVRQAAELAAQRGVPLQFHTGFGDADVDLPSADPALLRPLFHDPRTEACPVVLLHCHPYVRGAAYLAGTYPQVWMDLSLAIPVAEPIAASLLREALALCPATKLLAASDGHSYPEMHWWGAAVWDRTLREVLDAEVAGGALDEATASDMARRILSDNARHLYQLSTPTLNCG